MSAQCRLATRPRASASSLTDPACSRMMGNPVSNARLVVPDGDRDHRHPLRHRLECRVEAPIRDGQRCALEQLDLESRAHRPNTDVQAKRAGGGSGRVYTLTVCCTDPSGNASTGTTTVAVAH